MASTSTSSETSRLALPRRRADARRVENLEQDAVVFPGIARGDDLDVQAVLLQCRQCSSHPCVVALRERRRRDHPPDRETIRELRHAVEVIEIAVRENQRV